MSALKRLLFVAVVAAAPVLGLVPGGAHPGAAGACAVPPGGTGCSYSTSGSDAGAGGMAVIETTGAWTLKCSTSCIRGGTRTGSGSTIVTYTVVPCAGSSCGIVSLVMPSGGSAAAGDLGL